MVTTKPKRKISGAAPESRDAELIERCLNGEQSAWEELVKAHTRCVYSTCCRFTKSKSEAQDLTQDVFLRVFKALGTFSSTKGTFAGWLSVLTKNLLFGHYRQTKYERVTDSIDDPDKAFLY